MRSVPFLLPLLFLTACAQREAPEGAAGQAPAPPGREAWWKAATALPSGAERILAPRELRALLREGEAYGFDADAAWWKERREWAFDRILELDPDDVQANAGKGFKTLQSVSGFGELWNRMLEARVTSADIDTLLELYDHKVQESEPVFLRADAFEIERARLNRARAHLDRLRNDPQYEALQVALARVRGSSLNDYPFVHHAAGPFLLFYSAQDLQRIEGEDEAAESARIAARREVYEKRLASMAGLYAELVADIEALYPELWKQYRSSVERIRYQWIFGERTWYADFCERIRKQQPESPYRCGFLDVATGWAYLFEPPEPASKEDEKKDETARQEPSPDAILRETAAYLAAQQLLHAWGKQGLLSRLDRSRAYWLKEGWPAFMAARRVKTSQVGPLLSAAKLGNRIFPPLSRIVERQSRLELQLYREPAHEFGDDEDDERRQLFVATSFTDLARLLVRYLNAPERRAVFERYLLTQIAGQRGKLDWFEECFGVKGEAGWQQLQDAVYATIEQGMR